MLKRKRVLLPILLVVLVLSLAGLGVRAYYMAQTESNNSNTSDNDQSGDSDPAKAFLTPVKFAQQVNTLRDDKGLSQLVVNQSLMDAASNMAVSYMATGQTLVADTDWAMISEAGYQYSDAKILVSSAMTVTAANVQGFFDARSTNEIVTSKHFSDVGVAIVNGLYNGQETNVIILIFASPALGFVPTPYVELAPSAQDPAVVPGSGPTTEPTPTTCNESLKASYAQQRDEGYAAADSQWQSDVAEINAQYSPGSEARDNATANATAKRDNTKAGHDSTYNSSLASINCTP